MNPNDKLLFNLLKKSIVTAFSKENPGAGAIENWKGEQIVAFQEDLFNKLKARVSEKWFYTYFKNDTDKLPRIDMLNLLSAYVGYTNWNEFKARNSDPALLKNNTKRYRKYYWLLFIPFIIVIAFFWETDNTFHFCLVDEDKNEPISGAADITILQDGQSPLYMKTDSLGCFTFETEQKTIRFVVQSPYHKTDTIRRHIDTGNNPVVKLRTDDYALMLQYYSNGNTSDWKKRRQQLRELIDDDAQIYQMFSKNMGIELYSKEEFINKLTIPTSSLKNISILNKEYKNGKIVKLKFMIK